MFMQNKNNLILFLIEHLYYNTRWTT